MITSAYMIPYQAGLKVYISGDSRGLYGMGLLGGHTVGSKITVLGVESSDSNTLFSWGLGVGFRSYNVDLGLRFNSVSPDKEIDNSKASSYIALRVGFFLGGE